MGKKKTGTKYYLLTVLPNRRSSPIQRKQNQTLNTENAVEKNWLFYYASQENGKVILKRLNS